MYVTDWEKKVVLMNDDLDEKPYINCLKDLGNTQKLDARQCSWALDIKQVLEINEGAQTTGDTVDLSIAENQQNQLSKA